MNGTNSHKRDLLIEKQKLSFLLTGSSARKLKHADVNFLAERAHTSNLFPLVYPEIPSFDLPKYLKYGGLPVIYNSNEPWDDLKAYVDTYLKEEIQTEAAVRNLGNFTRFLQTAAYQSGQLLNYAAVSSDAQVPETTIRGYYQIFKDTLLGDVLNPWTGSKTKSHTNGKILLF